MNHGYDESIEFDEELDELERLSDGVLAHIDAGRFEDAERACRELARRFPDQIDSLERSGCLHEARGNRAAAIECYQRCLVFIEQNPGGFDQDSKDDFRERIKSLESTR